MAPSLWPNRRFVAAPPPPPPPPPPSERDAILVMEMTDDEDNDEGFIEAADIAGNDYDWSNTVVSDSEDEEETEDHWSFSDELRILYELIDGRRKYGRPPPTSEIFQVLQERRVLKRSDATSDDVAKKVSDLKEQFGHDMFSGGPREGNNYRLIYDLSAEIWGPQDF